MGGKSIGVNCNNLISDEEESENKRNSRQQIEEHEQYLYNQAYSNQISRTPQTQRPQRPTGFNPPEVKKQAPKYSRTARVIQAEMELPLNIGQQTQIIARTARNVQLQSTRNRETEV